MANQLSTPLVPVTEVWSSGCGVSCDTDPARTAAKLRVSVTAIDGPRLTVYVQTSPNEVTWRTVDSVALDARGVADLVVVELDRFVRVSWVLDGTSATFEVSGAARQLYATRNDLAALSLGHNILANADVQNLNRALVHGSELAAGYLGARFDLPLLRWGDDLSGHTAAVVAYRFMVHIGYAPEGNDEHIRMMYEDAIRWFERVAKGEHAPDGIIDSTPERNEGGPVIFTTPMRRW